MRLMRRLRDGKIAVYEPTCIATGRWEEVLNKPREPQKPRIPRNPRPVIRKTGSEQVMALFKPPIAESQKEIA